MKLFLLYSIIIFRYIRLLSILNYRNYLLRLLLALQVLLWVRLLRCLMDLSHPSTVCVTVYVPPAVTVIEAVVSPVLHNNVPVYPLAVSTELPQLSATSIDGAHGIVLGAATPLPDALVHPSTVCVTVYVPPVVTVMDAVVSPVLHNNVTGISTRC